MIRSHRLTPYAALAFLATLALLAAGCWLGFRDLWLSPDQRGRLLLQRGQTVEAAQAFRDPLWRGVALFRAGDFKGAAQAFAARDTAAAAFDQGNALVMLGQYDEALKRFDRSLVLRPGWPEALRNREIARIRAERRKTEGARPGKPTLGRIRSFSTRPSPAARTRRSRRRPRCRTRRCVRSG